MDTKKKIDQFPYWEEGIAPESVEKIKEQSYKEGLEAGKKLMQEEMKDILVAFNAKWGQQPIEEKIKDAEFILERNEFPERKLTTFYLWRK
jgi:N-acetyl-anhydromuramyl-L-alanine amidase AmpD